MSGTEPNKKIYSKVLVQLGEENPRIVVADADVSCSTGTNAFGKKFPDRFYNFGAAEQNMISAVAGMASCGLLPFASTFATFASMRACDQVRQSIAYTNLNVKIVANNAGLENNGDGVTHQAIEDMAIMRSLPNMTVLCPSDNVITEKAVRAAAAHQGPVYIRLGRYAAQQIHSEDVGFEIGRMVRVAEGGDLTIIATGRMVEIALEAVQQLKAKGISAGLLDCHTIKPIDKEAIIQAAKKTGRIITCEDHNIIGGLGSAVCEVLSENAPALVRRIGVSDVFARSARDYKDLFKKYGLTAENIVKNAMELLTGAA
ncbi:MAG: transketolase family protein [Christensenellaceae bacterium]|nr:transketolase family protein [Christensenellaceae bacterium]